MFPPVFDLLGDLYHVALTSKKLKIIIFQLGTPEYHNLDTKTTTLTRKQPYIYSAVRDYPVVLIIDHACAPAPR